MLFIAIHRGLLKHHTAYQDFFTLWKDADPDVPILKEAKRNMRSCNNR
jgi:hypothetical protein